MAKNRSFLKENKLRFTEDLHTADEALREKLWPLMEAAKKEGKKAHFAGVRVTIEAKEIRPPPSPHEAQCTYDQREAQHVPAQMDTSKPA